VAGIVAGSQTSGAQSQPPTPSLTKASNKHQNKSTHAAQPAGGNEQITLRPPIVVKVLNPPNADAIARELKKDREQRAADEESNWIFSWLLVLVGAGQAAVLLYTALVTSKTANAAKKSADALIAAERAYVFVKAIDAIEMRDAKGNVVGWQSVVVWRNSGTTPTKDMTTFINWCPFDKPIDENFYFADSVDGTIPYPGHSFIGPKAEIHMPAFRIGTKDIVDLREGKKFLYIWGWAEYRDIFPGTEIHRTEFCSEVVVLPVPGNPDAAIIDFRHFPSYNSAT
jgi:hypothetical protein